MAGSMAGAAAPPLLAPHSGGVAASGAEGASGHSALFARRTPLSQSGFGVQGNRWAKHMVHMNPAGAPSPSKHCGGCLKVFQACVVPEGHILRLGWTCMQAMLLLYSGVVMPYWLCFHYWQIANTGDAGGWRAVDIIVDACFWVDLLITFLCTYRDVYGREVTDIHAIARNYLWGQFWLNFASCLPPLLFASMFGPDAGRVAVAEAIFYFARTAVRLARVVAFLGSRRLRWLTVESRGRRLATFCVFFFWATHLLACVWYCCSAFSDNAEDESWVGRTVVDSSGARLWEIAAPAQWLRCLVYALTVIMSNGYTADPTATTAEHLFTILLMFCGLVLHSIVLGEMLCIVLALNEATAGVSRQEDLVASLAHHAELDADTAAELRRQCVTVAGSGDSCNRGNKGVDVEAVRRLIDSAHTSRGALVKVSRSAFGGRLALNRLFAGDLCAKLPPRLPPRLPVLTSLLVTKQELHAGYFAYSADDNPTQLFIVLSGTFVHTVKQHTFAGALMLCGAGNYFGDVEILTGHGLRRTTVSCESKDGGTLLALHRSDLSRLAEEFPRFAIAWRARAVRRLWKLKSAMQGRTRWDHRSLAAVTIQRCFRHWRRGPARGRPANGPPRGQPPRPSAQQVFLDSRATSGSRHPGPVGADLSPMSGLSGVDLPHALEDCGSGVPSGQPSRPRPPPLTGLDSPRCSDDGAGAQRFPSRLPPLPAYRDIRQDARRQLAGRPMVPRLNLAGIHGPGAGAGGHAGAIASHSHNNAGHVGAGCAGQNAAASSSVVGSGMTGASGYNKPSRAQSAQARSRPRPREHRAQSAQMPRREAQDGVPQGASGMTRPPVYQELHSKEKHLPTSPYKVPVSRPELLAAKGMLHAEELSEVYGEFGRHVPAREVKAVPHVSVTTTAPCIEAEVATLTAAPCGDSADSMPGLQISQGPSLAEAEDGPRCRLEGSVGAVDSAVRARSCDAGDPRGDANGVKVPTPPFSHTSPDVGEAKRPKAPLPPPPTALMPLSQADNVMGPESPQQQQAKGGIYGLGRMSAPMSAPGGGGGSAAPRPAPDAQQPVHVTTVPPEGYRVLPASALHTAVGRGSTADEAAQQMAYVQAFLRAQAQSNGSGQSASMEGLLQDVCNQAMVRRPSSARASAARAQDRASRQRRRHVVAPEHTTEDIDAGIRRVQSIEQFGFSDSDIDFPTELMTAGMRHLRQLCAEQDSPETTGGLPHHGGYQESGARQGMPGLQQQQQPQQLGHLHHK